MCKKDVAIGFAEALTWSTVSTAHADSPKLPVPSKAVADTISFYVDAMLLDKAVDHGRLIWDKAP